MSKKPDEKEIARVIWDYCQSNGLDDLSVWWETVGLEFRTLAYAHKKEKEEQKRNRLDDIMQSKGYIHIDKATKQLDMSRDQIMLLFRENLLKFLYTDEEGKKVDKEAKSRYRTYLLLEDIQDKQAIKAMYDQVKLISTEAAAKMMGVTSATFTRWADKAGITRKDEKWTNKGYKVYLWTVEQVNQVRQFRDESKSN